MAKRSPRQLADAIRRIRWIIWEITRIQKEYRDDVLALTAKWEEAAARPRFSGSPLTYRRITAARNALEAFRSLECVAQESRRRHRTGRLSSTAARTRTRNQIMGILRSARTARFSVVTLRKECPAKVPRSQEDLLPELGAFFSKWHLPFPLPTSLNLPESLDMDIVDSDFARPVKIVDDSTKERLVLQIFPAVGREVLLAFIDGALRNALPLRNTDQIISRKGGMTKARMIRLRSIGKCKLILELPLPCDLRYVRSFLKGKLERAPVSLREFREAIDVARLHVVEGLTFRQIAECGEFSEKQVGTPDETSEAARRRLVHQRYRTYQHLIAALL